MSVEMTSKTKQFRWLALTSNLALIVWIALWQLDLSNFILMLYFLHAFTILYVDDGERWLAAVELFLTFSAFMGNVLYARHRGKELGLKLTKLSVVEKQEKQRFDQE